QPLVSVESEEATRTSANRGATRVISFRRELAVKGLVLEEVPYASWRRRAEWVHPVGTNAVSASILKIAMNVARRHATELLSQKSRLADYFPSERSPR